MELARPGEGGEIHDFCEPNSLLTLMEYLLDNATSESRATGLELIRKSLEIMGDGPMRRQIEERLLRIKRGERDLFF